MLTRVLIFREIEIRCAQKESARLDSRKNYEDDRRIPISYAASYIHISKCSVPVNIAGAKAAELIMLTVDRYSH